MNRCKFVVPFLALSLLASCASPSEDTSFNFVFDGEACTINGQASYTEEIQKNEGRIYTIKTDNEYEELPEAIPDIPNWVTYNCRADKTSATLTINKMQANCTIKITAKQYPIEIQFVESVNGKIIDTVKTYKGVKWSQVKKPTFEQD